jgi:Chaperonin GroEL (HSP60 family)
MVGEDTLLRFGGVALGEACTVVIRGATQQIIDEAERSLHDALCVLAATVKETRVVYGGGKAYIMFIYCGTVTHFPIFPPLSFSYVCFEYSENSCDSFYA